MVESVANRSELIPRIWDATGPLPHPEGLTAFMFTATPFLSPFRCRSVNWKQKAPLGGIRRRGLSQTCACPFRRKAVLGVQPTPGPWVALPFEPLDSAMSAPLLSWKFPICQQERDHRPLERRLAARSGNFPSSGRPWPPPYGDSIRPTHNWRVQSACSETSGRWVTRSTEVPRSWTRPRISARMALAC